MVVLRDEIGAGVLFRREGGAIDKTPKFSFAKDQGILHRCKLLIEANLVFIEVFTADEPALVVRLLRLALVIGPCNLAALDSVAANVFERRASTVDENHRLNNLLDRELRVAVRVLFRGFGFLLLSLFFGVLWSGVRLRIRFSFL